MDTFNSRLMHDPQIPNFYLVDLESDPFFDNFHEPIGPQGSVKSKSCIRPNVKDNTGAEEPEEETFIPGSLFKL